MARTLKQCLDSINRAKTMQGVAGAYGSARMELDRWDPIAAYVLKVQMTFRMSELRSARIRTASDLRKEGRR